MNVKPLHVDLEVKMKVRIWSDLHADGAAFAFSENCRDEVLVIAGDTANSLDASIEIVKGVHDLFRHVIVVPGNHEYYRRDAISTFKIKFNILAKELGNVTMLDGDVIVIDDVTFIGATLWSDLAKGSFDVVYEAKRCINDFRLIQVGEHVPFSADWMQRQSAYDLNFIRESCKKYGGKKVVITHFPPIRDFQHPRWGSLKENPLNGYFMSDYSHEIQDLEFDLWICGHTHDGSKFEKWGKKFVCNPRGYCYRGKTENESWDVNLVVEV